MAVNFIKCFNKDDATKLNDVGFEFFKYENGIHWFILNDNIQLDFSQGSYEITEQINC